MRTIKTTTGAEIPLDGDLLTVMETLYHEVTARRELERSFEDMVREIAHLIDQMTDEERNTYLQESLFLNSVTYENERLGAYMRKLAGGARRLGARWRSITWLRVSPAPGRGAPSSCSATAASSAAAPTRTRSACWATPARRRVHDIWTGPTIAALRDDLNRGGSTFCGDCPLKLPLGEGRGPAASAASTCRPSPRASTSSARPPATSRASRPAARRRPASRARARPACSTSISSRASSTRPGPRSGAIDFFNYGEAFLHKRAVEMCEYIKATFPHIYLYTSTNGLAFTEESARRLVRSGIDEVTFSIDGASQETYARYRQRGRFDVAVGQPARDGGREADGRPRRARHQLALHPLHLERQRRGDGARAGDGRRDRRRSADAGRSRIIPRTRSRGGSCPGTPDYERIRHEVWDTNNLGNAIPGATPRARIEVPGAVAGAAAHRAARDARSPCRRASTTCPTRPFPREASYGRRLVRLGAQLCDAGGTVLEPRLRPGLAAAHHRRRRAGRGAHRDPRARRARPLPAEVRPRQRGHRLVRGLRVGDDAEAAAGLVGA